jgi:hypothetical protein
VAGKVTNNTSEDDPLLYIETLYYNSDGDIIGITGTNIL